MAAARFWRIAGVDALAGGDLELSEVALYEGGTRVDASATITSVIAPFSGSLPDLSDASFGTSARWSGAAVRRPGFALVWDFGAGVSKDVSSIGIAGPSRDRFANRFAVYSSTDGQAWDFVASTAPATAYPGVGQFFTLNLAAADPHADKVVLFLPLGGGVGSRTIADESPIRHQITPVGDVKIGVMSGYQGALLDGAGDAIRVEGGSALAFGTGDFTIEVWAIVTGSAGVLYDARPLFLNGPYVTFGVDSTNINLYAETSTKINVPHGMTLGQPYHFALSRVSGVSRIFVGGTMVGSAADTTGYGSFPDRSRPIIGALGYDETLSNLSGAILGVKVTKGVGRFTTNFTPPPPPVNYDAPIRTDEQAEVTFGEEVIGFTQAFVGTAPSQLDVFDAGRGRIVGTVKEKSTPANLPLKRRVVLLSMPGSRAIRETWSHPVTGAYQFNEIDMGRRYTVVSYDHTGIYRGVVADNLQPELMT